MSDILPLLILIGRPASGKSEIVEFLRGVPAQARHEHFHLGELVVLDDFPYLWSWMEEDALLERRLGRPRLHTDSSGYFLYPYLWDLLIERLAHNYRIGAMESAPAGVPRSFILEFSRGSEHGGYQRALAALGEDLLAQAAVMYVSVSYEESLRKNRRRFNPDRPGSILEHSLSDDKMDRLYRSDDWAQLTQGDAQRLRIGRWPLPFVIFENDDDVTSGPPDALKARLRQRLARLYTEWKDSRIR
jgi:hypothetical protein